jgi:hypothetical protein
MSKDEFMSMLKEIIKGSEIWAKIKEKTM